MRHYTLKELEAMPTLEQGHFDNVKVSNDEIRVMISRMTIEDGMPYNNQVCVEKFDKDSGLWQIVDVYEAK